MTDEDEAETMPDDTTLKQDIIDELDFEPSVDAADIGVTVDDGIATLRGRVPLLYQRTRAAEAVWRIAGVRGLVDELEIEQAGAEPDDDETLARHVLERLEDTVTVPLDAVRVQVERGWVTLLGEVEWDYQRHAAEQAVETLQGVLGVINRIGLSPTSVAGDVRERIEKALHRHADIEAARVDVHVVKGRVTLRGQVESALERGEIRRAAWSAPGVVDVIDEMTL